VGYSLHADIADAQALGIRTPTSTAARRLPGGCVPDHEHPDLRGVLACSAQRGVGELQPERRLGRAGRQRRPDGCRYDSAPTCRRGDAVAIGRRPSLARSYGWFGSRVRR